MALTNCKRILIVRADRIGDVVLTTPVFKALRENFPGARISVLLTPTTADLVRGNPYIDEVIVDDRKNEHKGLIGFLQLCRLIRQRNFDTTFIFLTKRRYNLACFLAGVVNRIGYKNNKLGILLTHPVKDIRHLGQKHEARYCMDLLKVVGIEDAPLDMFIAVNKEAEGWAMHWLEANHVRPGEIIAIHPGASDVTKCWPAASFARLIDEISSRYIFKVILIGGRETANMAADIKKLCKTSVLDLVGQTSVGQMASILRRSKLLISNDSGPLHVGAGVGTHVISLFLRNQPGLNPERWKPLGLKASCLANKAGEEIVLDDKGQVKSGKFDSISVSEVLEETERVLNRDSQSLFYW